MSKLQFRSYSMDVEYACVIYRNYFQPMLYVLTKISGVFISIWVEMKYTVFVSVGCERTTDSSCLMFLVLFFI